ncbi:MAG: hypothetical protein ACRD3Q_14475 [Terriglobales bacterium]
MKNETPVIQSAAVALMAACLVACACFPGLATAKDKKKVVLPDYVLWAHTVVVLIDPDVGAPVNDPRGNLRAQRDVEQALTKWGRLHLTLDEAHADLVIVLRKGTQPGLGGGPNDRPGPVIVQPPAGPIRIGSQQGPPVDVTQPGQPPGPAVGTETGPIEDTFSVYRGQVDAPLDNNPVWRYMAKNALHSPDVPAMAEFKKAVDEALKQQQQNQQKKH